MPPDPIGAARRVRRLRLTAACLAVVGVGMTLGLMVASNQVARVGPVDVRFGLQPTITGGSQVRVPPLGTMSFDTHEGPLALRASVVELRADVARQLAEDPGGFATLGDRVGDDMRQALLSLALRAVVGALLATGLLALLSFRSLRMTVVCLSGCVATLLATAGVAAATFRQDSIREPTFAGLLASAPTAIGSAEQIVGNFSKYRLALGQLVGNVVELYDVTAALPTYQPDGSTIAVLHVSDLHLNPTGIDLITSLVQQFDVRVVVDTGDLTDHGSAAEDRFVGALERITVPYVFVRGNHDSLATATAVGRLTDAVVLNQSITTVAGLRIAGAADPRFTPDKTTEPETEAVTASGLALKELIRFQSDPVDLALVHDPVAAEPLFGSVPLVLAGHRHQREQTDRDGTLLLVGGTTGGAGLRALEGDSARSLEARVLYFDRETQRLQAWDDVTVGGLGTTSVTVRRHVAGRQVVGSVPGG